MANQSSAGDVFKRFSIDTYVRDLVLVCNVCCDALTLHPRWAKKFYDGESLAIIVEWAQKHLNEVHEEN